MNDKGTFSANVPFTGSYTVGTQGRGTAALASSSGTSNYAFYIVNAKTIEFLNVDHTPGLIESGAALAQQNASFGNGSLGSSVFLVSGGDTSTGRALVAAGRFDTDGAGTIKNGVLDENVNGTFFDGLPFSGSYSIASNGRGTASVTTSNGTSTFVFWLASPGGVGQFMESDSFAATSGTALAQQGGPFSNSSIQGNFAFALAGASGSAPFAGLGQIASNGTGGLTGNEDFNVGSSTTSGVALTTTPIRMHLINQASAVFISADPAQPLIGLAEKQCSDCH